MLWIRDKFLKHQDPHEKYIVHGHSPCVDPSGRLTGKPEIEDNRTNLDTGATYGSKLTAGVFNGEQDKPIAIISV